MISKNVAFEIMGTLTKLSLTLLESLEDDVPKAKKIEIIKQLNDIRNFIYDSCEDESESEYENLFLEILDFNRRCGK